MAYCDYYGYWQNIRLPECNNCSTTFTVTFYTQIKDYALLGGIEKAANDIVNNIL